MLLVDVFVPVTTKPMMIEKLKLRGAQVNVGGANWNEADQFARQALSATEGSVYIPPFDHQLIWDGNSTIIDELVQSGLKPGAIVVSVGGGGLLRGIQIGLERHGWTDVKIIATETHGTASYAAAYAAGEVVSLPKIDSIATSLGALAVTKSTLHSSIETIPLVVSDRDTVVGLIKFADEQRILVEPACGASVITVYDESYYNQIQNHLGDNKEIVVIACGGSVVSLDMINAWKQQFEL
jgi:L-serine/L-threonine ammonia-lyase